MRGGGSVVWRRSVRSTVQVSEVSGAGPFLGWGPAPLEVPVRPICGVGQLDEIEPAPFILPTCATDYTDLHQALGGAPLPLPLSCTGAGRAWSFVAIIPLFGGKVGGAYRYFGPNFINLSC